jgi:hypothetical protein
MVPWRASLVAALDERPQGAGLLDLDLRRPALYRQFLDFLDRRRRGEHVDLPRDQPVKEKPRNADMCRFRLAGDPPTPNIVAAGYDLACCTDAVCSIRYP